VQYSNTKTVSEILTKYLSRYGKITTLNERSLIVVEDLPDFVGRIGRILAEIDVQPQQILIEAKILEITLDDSESFGINWNKVFSSGGTTGSIGTAALAAPVVGPRFFFSLVNTNLEVFLAALSSKGRVRTLSTPKLLALENQEASTVIGDQTGYRVTTTINQVTTESIQFLESGVILRVTPSVDERGRIMMKIHPEVSTASISDGIPSKKSTEVTTQLLAEDGQAVFIGGLIKTTAEQRRTGVPLLGDIPVLGNLFVRSEDKIGPNAETVVMITPHIVRQEEINHIERAKVEAMENLLLQRSDRLENKLERVGPGLTPRGQELPPASPAAAAAPPAPTAR
jgi:type II secretory pathway component GspD/PulD (secretin)